jgi:hypothetical protein
MIKRMVMILTVTGLLITSQVLAEPIIVDFSGPITGASCAPFGCMGYFGPDQMYQQVYSASLFPSPAVSISEVTFFNSLVPHFNIFGAGMYTVTFSITPFEPGFLDTQNLQNNIGIQASTFFVGQLQGPLGGPTFTLVGTPYLYTPSQGNLLMTVHVLSRDTNTQNSLNLDIFQGGSLTSKVFTAYPFYAQPIVSSEGLITQFTVSPVPTSPPVIIITATPATLWPPNGKMVPVTISGTITDADPDIDTTMAAYVVTDEYGLVQPSGPITLGSNGSYSFTIHLQASRHGNDQDGRQYSITVRALDHAGNEGRATTDVIVPHDQGH